jgi:hypothetical protein
MLRWFVSSTHTATPSRASVIVWLRFDPIGVLPTR